MLVIGRKNLDIGKLNIPESPGVYLMKKNNKVIYVGKAKNLKIELARILIEFMKMKKLNELC